MGDKPAGKGSDSGKTPGESVAARRRRQAEQLRRNLLKRKEQTRGRAEDDGAAPDEAEDPAQG